MADEPRKRTETRGQMTIKHKDLDGEFQTLVRMAAERQGMTVGGFIMETVRAAATAVLKGEPDGSIPPRTPPAQFEDVTAALPELIATAVGRASQEQAEKTAMQWAEQEVRLLAVIERANRRGRWRR